MGYRKDNLVRDYSPRQPKDRDFLVSYSYSKNKPEDTKNIKNKK